MSSLIVMPGSEEFKKTLASIAKAPSRRKLVQPVDLVGHTLMLNTALVKTFQCGGFVLARTGPSVLWTNSLSRFRSARHWKRRS